MTFPSHPEFSAEDRELLAAAEDLSGALFELAGIFRVPVTNNIPRFEDGDPTKPIYHVGDFIHEVKAAFLRFGWLPPMPIDRHEGDAQSGSGMNAGATTS